MSKAVFIIFVLITSFIFTACTPESKPIVYGEDKCDFCRMSIVDQRFGGEIVTQKGKVYKFDAVECVINYLDERVDDETKLAFVLTNAFDKPGELFNTSECVYLVSQNMPSPMGEFINPFTDHSLAKQFKDKNEGIIYEWESLRLKIKP
jgi:copper chaperone NosL